VCVYRIPGNSLDHLTAAAEDSEQDINSQSSSHGNAASQRTEVCDVGYGSRAVDPPPWTKWQPCYRSTPSSGPARGLIAEWRCVPTTTAVSNRNKTGEQPPARLSCHPSAESG